VGSDWEATEERLVARSAERRGRLARRDRRRGWLPWLLAPLVFPALGAAAFLFVLERAGGDFSDGPATRTTVVVGATFAVPAAVTIAVARRRGLPEAIAWGIVCAAVQVALVVGVGFLLLDLGPR
jgi:hypothetical protein